MAIAALRGAARGVSQATGIAQDNIIFAMVLFAFVVWVTSKGELSIYLGFFKPGANPTSNPLGIDTTVAPTSSGGGAIPGATQSPGGGGTPLRRYGPSCQEQLDANSSAVAPMTANARSQRTGSTHTPDTPAH